MEFLDRKETLKKLFGDPKHLTITRSFWDVISWNIDDVPHLENNSKLMDKLDKLKKEILNTEKNTTVKPNQVELILNKPNILTSAGMTEMAKRNTGESSTTNSHHAIGRDSTPPEALSDTILDLEVGRKEIGTRKADGQTERYATAFSIDDVSQGGYQREAGIFTAATGGILMMRVTFSEISLNAGKLITISTTVSHQNGTEE